MNAISTGTTELSPLALADAATTLKHEVYLCRETALAERRGSPPQNWMATWAYSQIPMTEKSGTGIVPVFFRSGYSLADIALYFADDGELFESRGISNGGRTWFARDFMVMLGYESMASFELAINRAIGTCTTLGISVLENFQQCTRDIGGEQLPDFKLSRFACYLVAMNGDPRKHQVAQAQVYFARLAEAARQYIQSAQDVERVQIRDEILDRERGLSSTAKKAGVADYALFQNAGYRGMYNVDLFKLKEMKGLRDSSRSLLDFMGKRELAGNLFRISETEARLKNEGIQGQRPAEHVAHEVGRKVRNVMIQNGGTRPELLPFDG